MCVCVRFDVTHIVRMAVYGGDKGATQLPALVSRYISSLLESLNDSHCNVQLAANSVDCHQKQFIICTLEVTPHLCPFYSHVGALLPTQLLHALLRV